MTQLPSELVHRIQKAGFFPELAQRVLEMSLGTQNLRAALVRAETTFDGSEVRRQLSLLAITDSHLLVVGLEDLPADQLNPTQVRSNVEKVRLRDVRSVGLGQVFDTAGARIETQESEVTLGINWGAMRQFQVEAAVCEDPHCPADHGYQGSSGPSDILLRVSALADGRAAVDETIEFYQLLAAAIES